MGKGESSMKYRILINSKHASVISDFFKKTSQVFDCLSTSDCLDDIANHFKLFRPEAYVCFNEGAQCGPLVTQMRALKSSHDFGNVPIVVVGDETLCKMLERLPQKPDLIICSETPVEKIISEITRIIQNSKTAAPSAHQSSAVPGPKQISVISKPAPKPAPAEEAAPADKPVKAVPEPEKAQEKSPEPEPAKESEPVKAPETADETAEVKKETRRGQKPPWPVPEPKIIDEPEEESSKPNILVIDDDRNILRLIKSACSDYFNITTMLNADLIDKYFENKTVDLILLDYEMPGENGPQVFQRLRKIPNAMNTPIVFLTGVSDRTKIQEVLSLKPQGYILKPINMEKLFSNIYGLIR